MSEELCVGVSYLICVTSLVSPTVHYAASSPRVHILPIQVILSARQVSNASHQHKTKLTGHSKAMTARAGASCSYNTLFVYNSSVSLGARESPRACVQQALVQRVQKQLRSLVSSGLAERVLYDINCIADL